MRLYPRFGFLFAVCAVVFVALTALIMLLAPAAVNASPATAEEVAEWEVLLPGLASPRDLIFGPDGALYVALAGSGGPETGVCYVGPEAATEVCLGDTGKVIRVELDDGGNVISVTDVITGLPSVAVPNAGAMENADAVGVHDIAFDEADNMYLTLGLGSSAISRTDRFSGTIGETLGHLVGVEAGGITPLVDLAAYEDSNNPDGRLIDSNPWYMVYEDGVFYVNDAGGNALLSVVTDTSTISTVATFPVRMVPFMTTTIPMEAVPTGVDIGVLGDFLVGQLTGFPFPPGEAQVYAVDSSGTVTTAVSGFTNIVDIAMGADGSLYVLEFSHVGLLNGITGAVTRVTPDGRRIVLADDLTAPTGLTVGPDGALYVTNIGASNAAGQLIRVETQFEIYLPIVIVP